MAIKLADTLEPMGNFPVADASDVEITLLDETKKSIQDAYEDGDLGGIPAVKDLPTKPTDDKVVIYAGTETGQTPAGHIYEGTNYYAFGSSDSCVYFDTPNLTQMSMVTKADDENYVQWYFYGFDSSGNTIISRFPGVSDPEMQYVLSGGRYSSKDHVSWRDITPAAFVLSMPANPSHYQTIIYTGEDTENYKKGHIYRYRIDTKTWYDLTPAADTSATVTKVDTLPIASASLVDQVVMYVGESSLSVKKGHVYKCKAQGASYSWEDITAPVVVPNPAADATDDMVKLQIGDTVYKWPRQSSSGQKNVSAGKQLNCLYETKDLLIFGIDKVNDSYTWTDGISLFYSEGDVQRKYNPSTKVWEKVTWNVSGLYGNGVWRDPVANETYYSYNNTHYKLNKTTYKWESVTWDSSIRSYLTGDSIRALPFCFDGENIKIALLLASRSSSYMYIAWLDGSTPRFSRMSTSGGSFSYSTASDFWSDGVNKLYYNNYSRSYVATISYEGVISAYFSSTISLIQVGSYAWYDKDWGLHADWGESNNLYHKIWDTSISNFVDVSWQGFPNVPFAGATSIKVINSNGYFCGGYYFYGLDLVNRVATKLISAGLAFVMGSYIWTDGIDIFANTGSAPTKKFDPDTLTFTDVDSGLPDNISGYQIWTDGNDIYARLNYKRNKTTKRFEPFEGFSGLSSLSYPWTDGTNIYSSLNANQHVLNKTTLEWTAKTWTGLTSFTGSYIWTDGTNIYYSYGTTQYVLDVATSTWSTKTWSGLTDFSGDQVWTKDGKTYITDSSYNQYVLDGSTWKPIPTKSSVAVLGSTIWTDGENYYAGNATGCCKLDFTNSNPTLHCKPVLTV